MSNQNDGDHSTNGDFKEEPNRGFGFSSIFPAQEIVPFDTIVKKTVLIGAGYVEGKKSEWDSKQCTIYQLLTLSQQTSRATFELASRGLVVPALILNRIRLEQLIVSSYLIHEEPQLGIEPFMKHLPISSFLALEAAFSDPEVENVLSKGVNFEKEKQKAIKGMIDINPKFNHEKDRFQQKWTELSLLKMAKKRDELIAPLHLISSPHRLQSYVVTIYKALNSVVHSDSLAISDNFLGAFEFRSEKVPVFTPNLIWISIIYSNTSFFDIIQLYETMLLLGLDCSNKILELLFVWGEASKKINNTTN